MTPAKKIEELKWVPVGDKILPKEQSIYNLYSSQEAGSKTYKEIKDMTFLIPHQLQKCMIVELDAINENYNITIQNEYTGMLQINVIDLHGKVLLEGAANKQISTFRLDVSVKGLASGSYLLEVGTDEDIAIQKISIQ